MLVCIMLDRPALQVLTIVPAIFTARQRSYGKVMFLQACVCSQGVGYLERRAGGRVSRRLGYPGVGYTSRYPSPLPRNYKSGRYASYWNAFLFHLRKLGVNDFKLPQNLNKVWEFYENKGAVLKSN